MAEKNIAKATPFQKEQIETAKLILEYKKAAEANIVSIIYKMPEIIFSSNLTVEDFSDNAWRSFFAIAYGILIAEKKNVLDDITIGLYLEKHLKLKKVYEENGGYKTICQAKEYVDEKNFDGYLMELKKWKAVLSLCVKGFPVKSKLSKYNDMSAEEIYDELEIYLNDTFIDVSENVQSYDIFSGMKDFIDSLDKQEEHGLPFYNAPLLTAETGGFNVHGNIYGLGAGSGVGKSTMAFNYLVPSVIYNNSRIVFIINEEDERKMKKELLIWVVNNIFTSKKEDMINKKTIRDGNFSEEVKEKLYKAAEWIEEKEAQHIFTVIPLERYSVNTVIKIINKYSTAFDVDMFVLDTLKESSDAKTDEIYKSMMRDMVTLYDVVKPSAKNVGLFVTYQLGKSALKMRHFTNNEIGQAKSIVDVMSVNLMMRRPYEDELEGGTKELKCWRFDGTKKKTQIEFKLKHNEKYMITFIPKNRFGETDAHQIVSECDLGTNTYKDIGFCIVPQDW